MKCAIHQPNFMPWWPYFQKIEEVDIFVMLGQCQFEKNGYQNRFNIGSKWFTMSVNKGLDPIYSKEYIHYREDWERITKVFPIMDRFDHCCTKNLYVTNAAIIQSACVLLGIDNIIEPDFVTESTGTERLVEICKRYHCNEYLSGISGKNYLNEQLFLDAGISISYQDESAMIKKPLVEVLNERI